MDTFIQYLQTLQDGANHATAAMVFSCVAMIVAIVNLIMLILIRNKLDDKLP